VYFFQVKYPEEERSVREGLMAFMATSFLGRGPTHVVFLMKFGGPWAPYFGTHPNHEKKVG
jgi:hypothetical protein